MVTTLVGNIAFETYGFIYDPDTEMNGEWSSEYIQKGLMIKGKLTENTRKLLDELEPFTEIKTLFDEDDTLLDKVIKTLHEYSLTYGDLSAEEIGPHIRSITPVFDKVRYVTLYDTPTMIMMANTYAQMNRAFDSSFVEEIVPFVNVDITTIKNKEVKRILGERYINERKNVPIDVLMYHLYKMTGLLKNGMIFTGYKTLARDWNLIHLDPDFKPEEFCKIIKDYSVTLSRGWRNYRNFFLLIKKYVGSLHSDIKKTINKLRNDAKSVRQYNFKPKYNTDKFFQPWLLDNISHLSIKELLQLIHIIELDSYYKEQGKKDYMIRNGSVFYKEYKSRFEHLDLKDIRSTIIKVLTTKFKELETKLREEMRAEHQVKLKEFATRLANGEDVLDEQMKFIDEMIDKEAIPFKLPEGNRYPIILSDKKRFGELYVGSTYTDMKPGFSVGITWYEDTDLDLSVYNKASNTEISWNTNIGTKDIYFSGDVTEAGTEYFTSTQELKDTHMVFVCNNFRGQSTPAQIEIFDQDKNVIWRSSRFTFNSGEFTVGHWINNDFIFDFKKRSNSNVRFSTTLKNINLDLFESNKPRIYLDDILTECGVKYIQTPFRNDEKYIFDLI